MITFNTDRQLSNRTLILSMIKFNIHYYYQWQNLTLTINDQNQHSLLLLMIKFNIDHQ